LLQANGELPRQSLLTSQITIPRNIMQTPKIQITQSDYNKLRDLLRDPSVLRHEDKNCRDALSRELARARIKPADEIPEDVITLYGRARLLDLQTNEVLELSIVLPEEINVEAGRISILAPLGTAMLGCREGDIFEWNVPGGQSRFQVAEVIFQPEATRRLNGAIL
jgi:regulator of nucleoside diphosphate kinase